MYNRVGDFPLVHLKKTEIKRNIVRSSSVRIAPPSKAVLNRDIRAAILRSNSFQLGSNVPKLMPTKMRAKEDDAHQIITNHDPLPIHESPQTAKSVLDALEKNCRKRINNEELTLDRNKRICATSAQPEVVDSPSPREFVTIIQQSAKRGREQVSPLKNVEDSPYAHMRKRMRTKNNALISSLSSSHYALKRSNQAPLQSIVKPLISTVTQNSKPLDEIDKQEKQLKEVTISSDKIPAVTESLPKPQLEKRLHLFNARADLMKRRVVADDDDEPKINFVKPREQSQASDVDILRHVEKQKLSAMLSGLSNGFKSPDERRKDFVDAPTSVSISFTTTSTTTSSVAPIATPALSLPSATSSNSSSTPSVPVLSVPTTVTSFSIAPNVAIISSSSADLANKVTSSSTISTPPSLALQVGPSLTTPSLALSVNSSLSDPPKPLAGIPFRTTASLSTNDEQTKAAAFPLGIPSLLTPSTKTSTSLIDPNKSLMTFTPVAKAPVASTTIATPATTLGGFGLTKSKDATSNGFSFGSNTNSNSVGTSNTLTLIPASTIATTSSLAFSAPATTAFSFGTKQATTTSAAPIFGMSTGISAVAPISGISGNLGSTVSFIQKPQTTVSSGVGFGFNTTKPSDTVANATFNFGGSTADPVTTTASVNFASSNSAFGQPAVTTTGSSNSVFGQPAATSTGFPTFQQKPQETQQPTGAFSFGQTPTAPVTMNSAAPSAFSFGGSNQSPVVTQQSGFSFGQSNGVQSTPAAPKACSIFSRLGEGQLSSISSPFGASNNALAPASSSMFGAQNNSTFNKPTNSVFGNSTTSPPSNDFGSAKAFSFGSSISSSNHQQQQQPTQPAATGMFSFGGNTNAPNTSSSNMFGASNQLGAQNVSAAFTFKPQSGVANNTPSVFGQAQPQNSLAALPNQFGNTQAIGNNVSASFTFGGSSANIAQTLPSQSAGFNFGGPQSAPVAPGGFSFPQSQSSLTPQPSSDGLFNIGTGGNQQRRPMRQATRRMK